MKTSKKNRAALVVVSDLHAGSLVGLCPPGMTLDGGGRYDQNPVQAELWGYWKDFLNWVADETKKFGAPITTVVNGDATEGTHHTQIVGATDECQIEAATVLLQSLRNVSKNFLMARGTPFHNRGLSENEEGIAARLGLSKTAHGGRTHFHLRINLAGVRFDVAHHVGNNSVPWTRGTGIRSEVLRAMFDYNTAQLPLPDVLIRSHVHRLQDTGRNFPIYGIVTPAWQAITEFGHKVARPALADIGGLLFLIENGEYQLKVKQYKADIAQEIIL